MKKTNGLIITTIAYLAALGAAVAVGWYVRDWHPIAMLFVADAVGTVVIFAFSYVLKNSSLYDPYWSVQPMVIAAYWLWVYGIDAAGLREWLVIALVWAWGARLTGNWAYGWPGLHHEDWRYLDLQQKHGKAYWLVSFSGIHFFPTVLVFAGCLPLWPVYTAESGFNWIDVVAALVTFGAIAIETLSDVQLHRYRNRKKEPGGIMAEGLWAYCRHPNYTGEVGFWWGLWLFALAANPAYWWTGIGALAINLLFVFISIPMMDERHVAKRPAYAEHMERVPALLPRVSTPKA